MKISIDRYWNVGGLSCHIHSTWQIEQWDSKSSKELSSSPAGSLETVPWGFNDQLWSVAGKREAFPRDLQHLVIMLRSDK